METAPNFACWTSTQSGVRWLVRIFITWPLFSTLLRKSACRDTVGIFRSMEMLSEIFFDAPCGPFHWFCGEMIVISNKYNFCILFTVTNYVMHIPGKFHCKGQALSRQSTGSGGHHRLSTVRLLEQSWWSLYQWSQNDHMTAFVVQCQGTW